MRRAAISLPSNVAEGFKRLHNKEYKQFLSIAYGSLCELETQYLLCLDLSYTPQNTALENFMKEVGRMLYRMLNPLRYPLSAIRS